MLTSSISTFGKPHVWISVRSFVLKRHRSLHSWPTAMFMPHVWISVRSFVLKKHRSLHSWPTAMFMPHVWISVRSFVLKKHRSLHSWPTAINSLFLQKKKLGTSFWRNHTIAPNNISGLHVLQIASSNEGSQLICLFFCKHSKKWLCHRPLSCATVNQR
jgi:menaquinone-dependent protoporphyrinogen IX oxidase